MDGMTLDGIKDDSIDAVVSNFGAFAFADRKRGWRAINRVLKPKIGKLIATSWDMHLILDQSKNGYVPNNTNPACFHNGCGELFANAAPFKNLLMTDDWHALSNPSIFKNEVIGSVSDGYQAVDAHSLCRSAMFENSDYCMAVFKSGLHSE